MTMLRSIVFALVALTALPAFAERAPEQNFSKFTNTASTSKWNLLEGVALNAAAATRTVTLETRSRWAKLRVFIFFTHTAASTVTASMSCSLDGTNYAPLQSRSLSLGVATLYDVVDTKPVSGNDEAMVEYDIQGCEKVKIVFAGAGAGASDTVNVQAMASVGQ